MRLSRIVLLTFGSSLTLYSTLALADNTLFTAMDDPATATVPFQGNIQAGYNAQTGNSESSTLLANSTLTWFGRQSAYSLWGAATNTTSSNVRSSERYQLAGRSRYNLTPQNYLFGQLNWLADRFNGYDSRTTLTGGYGRQLLSGPLHTLRMEIGPGVRHDEYRYGGRSTRILAYGAANYTYQLTDNARFTQGVSALTNDQTTLNTETALNVAINQDFSIRLAYTIAYNSDPPARTPKSTDTTTSVSIVYGL